MRAIRETIGERDMNKLRIFAAGFFRDNSDDHELWKTRETGHQYRRFEQYVFVFFVCSRLCGCNWKL